MVYLLVKIFYTLKKYKHLFKIVLDVGRDGGSDTDEKLSCCLKAGYIWQEGFSYFEDIPVGCKKYMNWND